MRGQNEVHSAKIENAAIQAEKVYKIMAGRNRLFGSHIFSDPAWNILLDLFIAHHAKRKLSISDVCVGSRCPLATCLRYISMLSDAGLVSRENDVEDKRRVHVSLTDKAVSLLVELLDKEAIKLREFPVAFDHADPASPLDAE